MSLKHKDTHWGIVGTVDSQVSWNKIIILMYISITRTNHYELLFEFNDH